jgi:hypothetical protein
MHRRHAAWGPALLTPAAIHALGSSSIVRRTAASIVRCSFKTHAELKIFSLGPGLPVQLPYCRRWSDSAVQQYLMVLR